MNACVECTTEFEKKNFVWKICFISLSNTSDIKFSGIPLYRGGHYAGFQILLLGTTILVFFSYSSTLSSSYWWSSCYISNYFHHLISILLPFPYSYSLCSSVLILTSLQYFIFFIISDALSLINTLFHKYFQYPYSTIPSLFSLSCYLNSALLSSISCPYLRCCHLLTVSKDMQYLILLQYLLVFSFIMPKTKPVAVPSVPPSSCLLFHVHV